MSNYFNEHNLGTNIRELEKSTLPASAQDELGNYPFYCSGSDPKKTNTWIQDTVAIMMGTGGVASIHLGKGRFAYSTDTWAFQSKNINIETEYVYRELSRIIDKINYSGFEGTGLKHLKKNYVRDLILKIPGKNIQLKIIEILQSIDTNIEQTDALIKKYTQIKSGLMHDLFTRGVNSDGKLRPPREVVPALYKETTIGWIPNEWDVFFLHELLSPIANNMRSGPFGSALLKEELSDEGIPFLGIDNIFVERFNNNYKRFISTMKFNQLIKYAVRPKDVVITIMGTVGRCCLIPEDIGNALSSKHLWAMTFDQKRVIPDLICWQLNYANWVKKWFRRETQGGIMDAIQSNTLKTLRLPTPNFREQILINNIYKQLNSKIDNLKNDSDKLEKQKLGLMHDLLIGKVQVDITESSNG